MCGIVGFYNHSSDTVSLECLKEMARSMRHRGPDDEGYYLKEGVGLGHVRLSILDLSAKGRQPMKSRYSDCYLVFNGEIYNYQDLRKELSSAGYLFETNTDTEVLLYALECWGLNETLCRINGMYAFGYWMEKEKKFILARDRLGKKPLYYYHNGPHFVFASELKAIFNYPFCEKKIDEEARRQYFTYHYVPSPYSIIKNIKKLPPGYYLEFAQNIPFIKSYWKPSETILLGNTKQKDVEDVLEETVRLLKSSIKYRLISDVPLGIFLSGGVDSALITALASQESSSRLQTFSIGFEESPFDEAPFAREVASCFGTDHHEYYLKPTDMLGCTEDILTNLDEPFGDSSFIPTYFVSKMARKHIKVALGGDGGDELLGGYVKYKSLKYAGAIAKLLPKKFRKKVFSFYNPSFGNLCEEWKSMDLVSAMMGIDLQTYLPDDILTKVDRASMANSLEVRAPLLDYHLVEFLLRLPLAFKIQGGVQKFLFKKILSKYPLEKKLIQRKKMGFCLPLKDWFRKELRYLLEKYLSPDAIRSTDFLNVSKVQGLIQEHTQNKKDHSSKLFAILAYQIWHDRYIERLRNTSISFW